MPKGIVAPHTCTGCLHLAPVRELVWNHDLTKRHLIVHWIGFFWDHIRPVKEEEFKLVDKMLLRPFVGLRKIYLISSRHNPMETNIYTTLMYQFVAMDKVSVPTVLPVEIGRFFLKPWEKKITTYKSPHIKMPSQLGKLTKLMVLSALVLNYAVLIHFLSNFTSIKLHMSETKVKLLHWSPICKSHYNWLEKEGNWR